MKWRRTIRYFSSPQAVEPTGICDICGFKVLLRSLRKQLKYPAEPRGDLSASAATTPSPYGASSALVDTGLRVCPQCYDPPNPVFGPTPGGVKIDPKPLPFTRPDVIPSFHILQENGGRILTESGAFLDQ